MDSQQQLVDALHTSVQQSDPHGLKPLVDLLHTQSTTNITLHKHLIQAVTSSLVELLAAPPLRPDSPVTDTSLRATLDRITASPALRSQYHYLALQKVQYIQQHYEGKLQNPTNAKRIKDAEEAILAEPALSLHRYQHITKVLDEVVANFDHAISPFTTPQPRRTTPSAVSAASRRIFHSSDGPW